MSIRILIITALAAAALPGCASVKLPDLDFMGSSDFNEEISDLEMSFPSPGDTPDMPAGVRTAEEWDESAREMQELYDAVEVPDLEPALSPEVFDRQFKAAKDEAEAYKDDDPS